MEVFGWLLLFGVLLALILMRPWEVTWGDDAWEREPGCSIDLWGDGGDGD